VTESLKLVPDSAPATPADPFDPKALRLTQDFLATAGVKKLLTTVPVRKPGRQDFVRVHPSETYRLDVSTIVLKDDDETYVVDPSLHDELANETVAQTLFTAINRQRVLFLWPVRLPPPDGRTMAWWTSAREAAEMAMTKWVRLQANKSLGAYEITAATTQIAEPEWPEVSFGELLRIAFHNKLVDKIDHPVIQRLRGLA
jgi:hypothetical protein